jgi:hypothetical protein
MEDRKANAHRGRGAGRVRPFENIEDQPGKGNKFLLTTVDIIAMVLRWFTTRHRHDDLALEFGVVRPTVTRGLQRGRAALLKALRSIPDAQIKVPSYEDLDLFADVIGRRYGKPPFEDVRICGFVDGTFIPCESPPDIRGQAIKYSGKECTTGYNNIFVATPDGCIIAAAIAYPGSMHDSTVGLDIMPGLFRQLRVNPDGSPRDALAGDIGFRSAFFQKHIVIPLSNGDIVPEGPEGELLVKLSRHITTVRQAIEWTNHTIKQTNLRLSLRLPHDPKRAGDIIETCVRMHNLRTRWEGIGQLHAVYASLMAARVEELRCMYLELQDDDGLNRNDPNVAADPDVELEVGIDSN